ncbi:MAG: PD40 domain-containing protein [Phaeodactylibacter sp.]|nr:PD40 domain-containing protein [Phaeodactylibacter sp.]MCB9303082.1 PD40 domain-containing protein [Lewinellaceae bacterium]
MRIFFLILIASAALSAAQGQSTKKQEAKEFFAHQHYSDALSVLNSEPGLVKTDQEAKFLFAICHYQLNHLNEAEAALQGLIRSEKAPYPECWLYLGKIYHAMHQFSKAADYYKDYLRQAKPTQFSRQMVWDDIRRCANGMEWQYLQTEVVVENMGRAVNTEYDEFAPIVSPNFSNKLYFSSIRPGNIGGSRNKAGQADSRLGRYSSDLFSCEAQGSSWGQVKAMHYLLNSPQNEVLLDFNADGSVLYYFKGNSPEEGQIFVDTFRKMEERTLSTNPFLGPISPRIGDGTPFFVNDTLLYFSSRRPGGFGGLDLYSTTFSKGKWTAPQNLGPVVNTPYDETTPFLARDGRTLYFSSNHPGRSMGGLDVLKSVFNKLAGRWTEPENLGMPVNSAGDDAYFRVGKDGFTAYFASSRKDGYGQRDLYLAYFNNFLPEMELPATYQPLYAEKPQIVEESIPKARKDLATEPETPKQEAATNPVPELPANAFTPIYVRSEMEGLSESNKIQLERIAAVMKEFSGLQLVITAFCTEKFSLPARLFKGIKKAEQAADYLMEQGVAGNSIFMRCGDAGKATLKGGNYSLEFSFLKPDGFPQDTALPDLEMGLSPAIAGHEIQRNLLYKVQISSLSGQYNGQMIEKFPGAMVEKNPNLAYYRYTLGAFSNYNEAEAFRKEVLKAGQKSAFVVPYIYGVRADRPMARKFVLRFPDLQHYTN